jgi:hypothetical protein
LGREPIVPEIDEKAMKFVEDTLRRNPQIQLDELFQRTKKVSSPIGQLSKRQFNARYPLQVKRRKALVARAKGPSRKKGTPARGRPLRAPVIRSSEPRDLVRQVFLQFALDIAAAEERKDLVKVLAGVDNYVDLVLKGAAKA